jgi:hypothetical protein
MLRRKFLGRICRSQESQIDSALQHERKPGRMQYLLLIYGNEAYFETLSAAERDNVMTEYTNFTKSIAPSGHFRGGNELQPTGKATTVRVRDKTRCQR